MSATSEEALSVKLALYSTTIAAATALIAAPLVIGSVVFVTGEILTFNGIEPMSRLGKCVISLMTVTGLCAMVGVFFGINKFIMHLSGRSADGKLMNNTGGKSPRMAS